MDEDIYSLAFVTSLSDEQITPFFDVIKGELINVSDSDSEEEDKKELVEKKIEVTKVALGSLNNKKQVEEAKEDEFTRELEEKKQLKIEQRNFEVRKQKRLNIVVHCYLCYFFQMWLIVMLLFEIKSPTRAQQINLQIVLMIILARFICGTMLHLSLVDEVTQGLIKMKYALNHPYKFQSYSVAF